MHGIQITTSQTNFAPSTEVGDTDQDGFLRAAYKAIGENDLEAFRKAIAQVNLDGYTSIGGPNEPEFLTSALFINSIQEHPFTNREMYIRALLDQQPNLDLPYKKGGHCSYLDYLTNCRVLCIDCLAIDFENPPFETAALEKLEKQVYHMASLLEIEPMDVVNLYLNGNRAELETRVSNIDLVLDLMEAI